MAPLTEIGSEFWAAESPQNGGLPPVWSRWPGTIRFCLSGRTALDAVLTDILARRPCRTALLPSYCCQTMIEPFLRHGLRVDFYPVELEKGRLTGRLQGRADVVLFLRYFGYDCGEIVPPEDAVSICDLTHSLLRPDACQTRADYFIASFRKWGAVAGAAAACKTHGDWQTPAPGQTHTDYLRLRRDAYVRKAAYLAGKAVEKASFLALFDRAERLLEDTYTGFEAETASLETAAHFAASVPTRRENAAYLLRGLADCTVAEPLVPALEAQDAPLFVPIFVKDGRRDALRAYLIRHQVYCPTHWPVSELHRLTDAQRRVYDRELSLVCDQRYGTAQMERQLDLIRSFERTYG